MFLLWKQHIGDKSPYGCLEYKNMLAICSQLKINLVMKGTKTQYLKGPIIFLEEYTSTLHAVPFVRS